MKTIIVAMMVLLPVQCFAVSAPWSTSFVGCSQDADYPSDGWACGTNQALSNNVNYNVCTGNGYQQVSLAANNPLGAGGRGWRRWVCGGSNYAATGSLSMNLGVSEFWLRWYMRWQSGFEWNSANGLRFQKVLFIRPFGGIIFNLNGVDRLNIEPQMGNPTFLLSPVGVATGWNKMNPSGAMQANGARLGDASWHSIEVHWKNQSGSGTSDGVWETWIDGVLTWSKNNINWFSGYSPVADSVQFMINQSQPSNLTPMYNDIDDIAISTTGYIGPLSSSSTGAPKSPSGLTTY